MAYADFTYYRDIFSGILITNEAMFRPFAERASDFIDTATFDRLADAELLERHKAKIQKCACELSEQFFRRNTAVSGDFSSQENMMKTSESIGSYSVSYANPLDYVQEVSMSDSDFHKSLKSTILHYLGNTGLLYRGVD
ncbi:MAG: hypothetical protein K2K91_02120 [Ruminococcus sp.]|nr:hypothetical protein [Ruminococcus sp.]